VTHAALERLGETTLHTKAEVQTWQARAVCLAARRAGLPGAVAPNHTLAACPSWRAHTRTHIYYSCQGNLQTAIALSASPSPLPNLCLGFESTESTHTPQAPDWLRRRHAGIAMKPAEALGRIRMHTHAYVRAQPPRTA